ncbi:MAG: transcription antitermination factor NusB [Bacillota bacterium]
MSKNTRHQNRIWALEVLYSIDLKNNFDSKNANIECENIIMRNNLLEDNYYFKKLVLGVIEKKEDLDEYINNKAIDWDIQRMAVIDRNILRIALYEIEAELVPVGVAIDEAVELAKEYGDDKSSSFINGILSRT